MAAKKTPKLMSKAARFEALVVAQEMLARVMTHSAVKAQLEEMYGIGKQQATSIVQEAFDKLCEPDELEAPKRRKLLQSRMEALYRKAMDEKKLNVCVELLKLQSRLWGLDQPVRIEHSGTISVDKEFESRSEYDLQFYIDHGYWPEEAGTPANPIEKLH